MNTCPYCPHRWYIRKATHEKRRRCPKCHRRLAPVGRVSGRRLLAAFQDGRSAIGLARLHALPLVVVERRLRAAMK